MFLAMHCSVEKTCHFSGARSICTLPLNKSSHFRLEIRTEGGWRSRFRIHTGFVSDTMATKKKDECTYESALICSMIQCPQQITQGV